MFAVGKIELNEKFLTLNNKKNNVEIQLAEQVEKCQLLEAEKKELEEKLAEQQGKYQTLEAEKKDFESKLTEQEGMCQKLETENKELEEKLAEQQGRYQILEAEKKDFESKLTEQEGICQKLYADKVSVERSYAELQQQQDEAKTQSLIEAIKSLSQMLQYSLGTSLSPKWLEYLGRIKSDIDKFITEEQTISDITLKIVSKNGWLAKLTSIRWWSKAISVKMICPLHFKRDLDSIFLFVIYNIY